MPTSPGVPDGVGKSEAVEEIAGPHPDCIGATPLPAGDGAIFEASQTCIAPDGSPVRTAKRCKRLCRRLYLREVEALAVGVALRNGALIMSGAPELPSQSTSVILQMTSRSPEAQVSIA